MDDCSFCTRRTNGFWFRLAVKLTYPASPVGAEEADLRMALTMTQPVIQVDVARVPLNDGTVEGQCV